MLITFIFIEFLVIKDTCIHRRKIFAVEKLKREINTVRTKDIGFKDTMNVPELMEYEGKCVYVPI